MYLYQALMHAERGLDLPHSLRLAHKAGWLIGHSDESVKSRFRSWQYECLGLIKLRQGRVDQAISDLERAIAMRSDGLVDEGSGCYYLALAYTKKAQANPADSAQWHARARQRCLEARQATIRGVLKQETTDLLEQLDMLERISNGRPPESLPAARAADSTAPSPI
ncbi:MAG: hypothetical protein WCE73_13305, partial [Candidatus Angelobacter sp.]